MKRFALVLIITACAVNTAIAQTTEGSIRGYVHDEQGGTLPGVTLTARTSQSPSPRVAVTDQDGQYRLS